MPTITLKAHFDGRHIVPDEPVDLPANVPISVTIFAPAVQGHDTERAAWLELSARQLARAYGDDEPEYTLADIKS